LIQRRTPLDHRIESDGQQRSVLALAGHGPHSGRAAEQAAAFNCCIGRPRVKKALGRVLAMGRIGFSYFFFYRTILIVSCSDFVQISNSFLYSNYSNENFV
jgi:hypothetical protein